MKGPRIQNLKSAIAKCEQPNSMCVSTYHGKLHSLWEELNKHKPLISCSCCSNCEVGSRHASCRSEQKLHDFLMGLHIDYHPFRSNILSPDPLLSFDRASHLVVQDERVRSLSLPVNKPTDVLCRFVVQSNTLD